MKKGDILGHEFCGIVESVGPGANRYKPGDRVVASFQIACGSCFYCKRKLSSVCEQTNSSELEKKLYGRRTAGKISTRAFEQTLLINMFKEYLDIHISRADSPVARPNG
jgi:threonine dehydrogenase-like Zn-dependent dehydrogenase